MVYMFLGLLFLGPLAFWVYVPSDNPKSMRSQTQFWMKNDPIWKFIILFTLWGGGACIILLALIIDWSWVF